jgi:hypothetical protein
MWSGLQQKLLPRDKWFGIIDTRRLAVARDKPALTSDVTTGSIAPAESPVPAEPKP